MSNEHSSWISRPKKKNVPKKADIQSINQPTNQPNPNQPMNLKLFKFYKYNLNYRIYRTSKLSVFTDGFGWLSLTAAFLSFRDVDFKLQEMTRRRMGHCETLHTSIFELAVRLIMCREIWYTRIIK